MIVVTISQQVRSRNSRGRGERGGRGAQLAGVPDGRTDGRMDAEATVRSDRGSEEMGRGGKSIPEAPRECWSDKLLSGAAAAVSRAAVPAAGGGAGHRAKPVLNALLNFSNSRRAVNHLGGSGSGLGRCSCRIWPSEAPPAAEYNPPPLPLAMGFAPADPPPRIPTTQRPADYASPLIPIARFDLSVPLRRRFPPPPRPLLSLASVSNALPKSPILGVE